MSRIIRNGNDPIGVFDSGLGGLTVVKELLRQLPYENIVYYGDTARVPYGTKSKESIIRFSMENVQALLKYRVKMIVVACNSSSSYALASLKKNFSLPIVGVISPGAKKAVAATKNNRVGIIATPATIKSQQYVKHIQQENPRVKVFAHACPLFVPLVEEGWLNKKITFDIAEEYLRPLKKARIDTLILGCTHYPLLREVLQKVMGRGVILIDSAKEVVLEVKNTLERMDQHRQATKKVRHKFITTDKPQQFQKIVNSFLGNKIKLTSRVVKLVTAP